MRWSGIFTGGLHRTEGEESIRKASVKLSTRASAGLMSGVAVGVERTLKDMVEIVFGFGSGVWEGLKKIIGDFCDLKPL